MYYFIGIKGTGMASLACILYDLGYEVCGSDQPKHFFTEDELVKRGIRIYDFDPANIKEEYTVIIGNAFLEDFPEVIAARKLCKCYRYHEFLGELMKDYVGVSICGSHGIQDYLCGAVLHFKSRLFMAHVGKCIPVKPEPVMVEWTDHNHIGILQFAVKLTFFQHLLVCHGDIVPYPLGKTAGVHNLHFYLYSPTFIVQGKDVEPHTVDVHPCFDRLLCLYFKLLEPDVRKYHPNQLLQQLLILHYLTEGEVIGYCDLIPLFEELLFLLGQVCCIFSFCI